MVAIWPKISAPMFAIFGSKDDYESEPGKKLELLKAKAKNCETKLFDGANHWFSGNEAELGKTIAEWIKITVS